VSPTADSVTLPVAGSVLLVGWVVLMSPVTVWPLCERPLGDPAAGDAVHRGQAQELAALVREHRPGDHGQGPAAHGTIA